MDATEAKQPLLIKDEAYDTRIRSFCVSLSTEGLRAKHVVIAKETAELNHTTVRNQQP